MEEKIMDILSKIEALDRTHHFSQISRQTGQVLHSLVLASRATSILELGTSAGYSTIWLALAVQKNNGKVYTIEKDPKKIIFAKRHIDDSNLNNIALLEGDIIEILKKWGNKIDFLFIDAEKGKYLEYFHLVEPHLGKNAIIVADNIKTIGKGTVNIEDKTRNYVDFFKKNNEYESVLLDIGDGLLVSVNR